VSPDILIEKFKNNDHFRTFVGERNPSFSTNCHVLAALLRAPDLDKYAEEIEMVIRFLFKLHDSGDLRDKWVSTKH
jgi:hypothetical protein